MIQVLGHTYTRVGEGGWVFYKHLLLKRDHYNNDSQVLLLLLSGACVSQTECNLFVKSEFLCRLRSIATHRDHFVRRPSVCLSIRPSVCLSVRLSHSHSYVSQATHAFLGMLPLYFELLRV